MNVFVGAIIENPEFGFLLQKRDNIQGIPYPNLWTLFGGKVEEGETPEQGLFRELREELNFEESQVIMYSVFWDVIKDDGNHQVIYHIKTNAKITDLVLEEGCDFGFFRKEEIFDRDFAFNIREVLESFFSTN